MRKGGFYLRLKSFSLALACTGAEIGPGWGMRELEVEGCRNEGGGVSADPLGSRVEVG